MKVKVFASPIRQLNEAEFVLMTKGLPDFQQKRFNPNRPGSLFAWRLLAYAVDEVFGLRYLPKCEKPEGGKPYFPELSEIHFSLSHNDTYAVCALHDNPVGCDIESMSRRPAQLLISKTVTSSEREVLDASDEPEKEFMRLWTLKEAKLKKDGSGLAGGIGKTDMADILVGNNYRKLTGECFSCFEFEGEFISICGADFADCVISIKI